MGDFTDGSMTPSQLDRQRSEGNPEDYEEDGFDTGLEGIKADGEKDGVPIFDVSKNDFYQNMSYGRQRLRFSQGTNVQKFHSGTHYKKPFFIKHKSKDDGREYMRKVK